MSEELAGLRTRLQQLKNECQTIGQAPPHPGTLRASLSAVFVTVMQRLMFWYAPPLQRTIGGLIGTLEEAIRILGTRLEQETQRSAALETRLHQVHSIVDEQIQTLRAQNAEMQARYADLQAGLREQVQALHQERSTTIDLENNLHEQVDVFQQFQEDSRQREKELAAQSRAAEDRLQMLRREVVEHARRVGQLLEEARRRLPAPLDTEQLRVFEQESLHDLDPLYSSLEDETRGSREEVRERLRVYLPFLEQAKAKLPQMSVLDLGSGRGEWLELLRSQGYTARGVDWNRFLVEDCRSRQLEVEQGDAVDCLAAVPDASLSVVTAFHLAEHLPFRKLIRLLDEITRTLETGGVAILETPNPDNLLVGARSFWHRHAIPSETLRFLVESRGLSQSQVVMLNSSGGGVEEEGELAQRFNGLLYGPRDYAVVAWKV